MTADGRERALRDELVALGASLFGRRLTFGRTGNLSIRVGDHLLVTPTGSSLGDLDPGRLEETAKLFLLLHGQAIRPLTDGQAGRLRVQAKTKETR